MPPRKFPKVSAPDLIVPLPAEISDCEVKLLKGLGTFDRPNSAFYKVTLHDEKGDVVHVKNLNGANGPTHRILVRFSLNGGDFSEPCAADAIRKKFLEKLTSARALSNFPGEPESRVWSPSEPTDVGGPDIPVAASTEAEDSRSRGTPPPQLPGAG